MHSGTMNAMTQQNPDGFTSTWAVTIGTGPDGKQWPFIQVGTGLAAFQIGVRPDQVDALIDGITGGLRDACTQINRAQLGLMVPGTADQVRKYVADKKA